MDDSAALAHGAVFVALLGAIGEVSYDGIDEDIAGPCVEVVAGVHVAVTVREDEAQVCYNPDVLACAELSQLVQEEGVEEGDQGSTLVASSLVADAEVGNGGDATARGKDGAFGHCEGMFGLALFGNGEEPDGLAVGAEDVDG